jgi:hypothetical protein
VKPYIFSSNLMILNRFLIKNKIYEKINIWKFIQASGRPDTVGPVGLLVQHNPLNGDRAVPGLQLRPDGPTRHDLFLFRAVPGHAPEGTSSGRLRPSRPGTARWLGIVAIANHSSSTYLFVLKQRIQRPFRHCSVNPILSGLIWIEIDWEKFWPV